MTSPLRPNNNAKERVAVGDCTTLSSSISDYWKDAEIGREKIKEGRPQIGAPDVNSANIRSWSPGKPVSWVYEYVFAGRLFLLYLIDGLFYSKLLFRVWFSLPTLFSRSGGSVD